MEFASNRVYLLYQLRKQLVSTFQIKLHNKLQLFFCWQLRRSPDEIFLGQSKYVIRIVVAHNLLYVKPVASRMFLSAYVSRTHPDERTVDLFAHRYYHYIIGEILYLSTSNGLDILFRIYYIGQAASFPGTPSFTAGEESGKMSCGNIEP